MQPRGESESAGGQPKSRGGRPTREQSAHRRNHLLDTAAQAFVELGFAGASIDEIAARAGVSKPTIYAHFQNKAGLFTATVEHALYHRLETAEGVAEAGSGIEALRLQVANIISAAIEPTYLGLFKLYLAEGDRFPDLFTAFSTSTERSTRQLLIGVLEHYPEFQSLRVPAIVAANFILQCILSPVVRAVAEPSFQHNMDVKKEAYTIVDHALFGIMKP